MRENGCEVLMCDCVSVFYIFCHNIRTFGSCGERHQNLGDVADVVFVVFLLLPAHSFISYSCSFNRKRNVQNLNK